MTQKECSNCSLSEKISGNVLICKRYPPSAGWVLDRSRWVRVEPNDWCGEFKAKRVRKDDYSK